jgi:hypothetical protein
VHLNKLQRAHTGIARNTARKELTMSDNPLRSAAEDDDYEAFERKMLLFEEGPTTTNFQQLIEKGVALPPPDQIADADVRTKLWEVLSGLSELRVYLDHTDHLSERELYSKLWNETLREDVPAIDEIGFNTHVQLLSDGEEDMAVYLKYFADEKFRGHWIEDFPDYRMPAHEDPPYNRDCLLPRPAHEGGPEALAWLRANHNESPLATNRFSKTSDAIAFVEQLYAAGATGVWVDNIMMLPNHDWTPYADTLIVDLPGDDAKRHEVLELIEHVGRPDHDAGEPPPHFIGPASVRLWWD